MARVAAVVRRARINGGQAECNHPPLEGEGRIAEGNPGWGGSRAANDSDAAYAERPSPPPGPLTRADLPPAVPRYSEGSATQQTDRSSQQPTSAGGRASHAPPKPDLYRLMTW